VSLSGEIRFWDSIGIGLAGGQNYSTTDLGLSSHEAVTNLLRVDVSFFFFLSEIVGAKLLQAPNLHSVNQFWPVLSPDSDLCRWQTPFNLTRFLAAKRWPIPRSPHTIIPVPFTLRVSPGHYARDRKH
jgi:hypothetical protein